MSLSNAPTDAKVAHYAWLTFLANPVGTLGRVTLVFRELGTTNFSGSCVVAGELHAKAVGKSLSPQNVFKQVYNGNTVVASLTTSPGGNGSTYWFPYVMNGVGECDVSYHAPIGTVALTAGMNGCSLRLYVNTKLGIVKFCHDNNGLYCDDAAYGLKNFTHLLSINASGRQRGLPAQNIDNYWKGAFDSPGSGVYFISLKTGPSQWSIYKSIVVGSFANRIIPAGIFSSSKTEFIQTYSGNQQHNGLVSVVNIPPLAPPVVAATDAGGRARSRSI